MKQDWWDRAVEFYRVWKGEPLNRIALFLVVVGAGAATGWGQQVISAVLVRFLGPQSALVDSPIWVGLSFVVIGAAVAVWASWTKLQKTPPHPNDVALLARFRALMNANLVRHLREHSFGQTFNRSVLNPLEDLHADWRDAQHEFIDEGLQELLAKVRAANDALMEIVGERLYVHHVNMDWYTAYTNADNDHGVSPETLEHIRTMNKRARALYTAIQHFERRGARKIDAFGGRAA